MQTGYFITGIGTEIGKTVVSAILTEAWKADYWKPVQAGDLDNTDSMKIARWITNAQTTIHPETHQLHTPMSPHAAAAIDKKTIQLNDFQLPETERPLIVEGAGGLLVPLNNEHTILDLIKYLGLPVLIVSRHYLGSINHTLLTIQVLKQHQIPVAGLIFNGIAHSSSEDIIARLGKVQIVGKVPELNEFSKQAILQAGRHIPSLIV